MTAVVRDSRPPLIVVRALNVVLRGLLRTPIARWIGPLVLLEFDGRRSGRRYRVPIGWYEVGGGRVLFTPAPWRANFATGAPVVVRHRARRLPMVGTLVTDPARTAEAINEVLASAQSTRFLAVAVEPGDQVHADDITRLGSAMVVLRPA